MKTGLSMITAFVLASGFVVTVFAEHDPNQPQKHSIILPNDMKEKTFDEFMEWCIPFYEDRCHELYEKKQVPTILSPLKQFNLGIPFSEIKCNMGLQLTQRHGIPACVKPDTYFELIERGWVSDITRLVQSRGVFLDPKDATSSYMDKITPLDDFKNILSESYDIGDIFSKFGEPHRDIGSGIHIYVYKLNDLTEIWIGYVDDIWYVKHVDADGNVLEDLFAKNER